MSSADDASDDHGDPVRVAGSAVQPDVAALYDRYADVMHASARKVLDPNSMESDAGDAVSIVIGRLQTAHARGELKNKDHWESYLRWAARNEALRIVKQRLDTASLDKIVADDADIADTMYDRTEGLDPVADEVVQRADERDVRAAIASAGFTDRQMYVLFGYFIKDMTDEQIGQWLGITGQAVGKMRRRAQEKLRELLTGGRSR